MKSLYEWKILLHRPQKESREVFAFNDLEALPAHLERTVDDIKVTLRYSNGATRHAWTVEAQSLGRETSCYISLACRYEYGIPYAFAGEVFKREVTRQSPHDPADHVLQMTKQAVPLVALKLREGFLAMVSDHPASCDNYTTQTLDPRQKTLMLSSGDSGETTGNETKVFEPYYHRVNQGKTHVFHFILFTSTAHNLSAFRITLFDQITAEWGKATSLYHSLCFASNYIHYRKNEVGSSDHWIVPGIDYANKQYTRDAFWQSMILPLDMEQQVYDAVYEERYKYAEAGLLFLIWSYRLTCRGGNPDLVRARDALTYVKNHTRDGWYDSRNTNPNSYVVKSWYDTFSFEHDDVITYNQGLLPVALECAKRLCLDPSVSSEQAANHYRSLFLKDKGFFPLSRKKPALCVDALVGDLLSQRILGQPLAESPAVQQHYQQVVGKAKTAYGYKVTCKEDGDYLPASFHGIRKGNGGMGFFEIQESYEYPGVYQWGGSWYLYDQLFLISAYLHGIDQAEEEMIWRTILELDLGGTTHEHINTATGKPGKPSLGWNAAIYAIWDQLMQEGKASNRYFEAVNRRMQQLLEQG